MEEEGEEDQVTMSLFFVPFEILRWKKQWSREINFVASRSEVRASGFSSMDSYDVPQRAILEGIRLPEFAKA